MALPHFSPLSPVFKNNYECSLVGKFNSYSDISDISFNGELASLSINLFENTIKNINFIEFLRDIEVIYLKIVNKQGYILTHKLMDCDLIKSTLNFSWESNDFLIAFAEFKLIKSIDIELESSYSIKQIQRDLKLKSIISP